MLSQHRHRGVKRLIRFEEFTGPVSAETDENNKAWFGTCQIDTCVCGSIRYTNRHGEQAEFGSWDGGEQNYIKNPVAYDLSQKGKTAITEKRREASRRNAKNAKRPRGEQKETFIDGYRSTSEITGKPVRMELIRLETPGGRRSWEVRLSDNFGIMIGFTRHYDKKPAFEYKALVGVIGV